MTDDTRSSESTDGSTDEPTDGTDGSTDEPTDGTDGSTGTRQDATATDGDAAAGTTPGVRTAVAENAVELRGSDPTLGSDELGALDEYLADRSVVGLGEATHGTREFFQLKHRLVRHLVEERDYRLFGLEANFTETMALDEYVREGRGDPGAALEGTYFWTWQTEEVLGLVEWLREFNAGRDPEDKVRFYGLDAQYTSGAVAALEEFFATVDPDCHDAVADDLAAADDEGSPPHMADDETVRRRADAAERLVARLRDRFDEREAAYAAATSRTRLERARRHLETVEQARERTLAVADDDYERAMWLRDRGMADTVDWIRDHEDRDRIAVWAHDEHVNRSTVHGAGETAPSMGHHLAERYGGEYYAVGFVFERGAFQAVTDASDDDGEEEDAESYGGLQRHAVGEPPAGTLPRAFGGVESSVAFLDVAQAREDDRLRAWLDADRRTWSIGSTFDPDAPTGYLRAYRPTETFDGFCYVRETGRARPLE